MSKKMLAVFLALIMVIGCVSAVAEETVKLTLWTFQELHLQLYKDQLEKYNAQTTGPKLEIDMQVYPYEDLHSKLTIALQTGEGAPDISDIEINMFANYLKGDIQLAAMNDHVEPIKDKLVMARLDNYARQGNYYGIDHHIGACAVFYNTEILEAAGVDYKTIKTWDDFAAAGKLVLEKTGKPMTSWETGDCWSIYPLVSQHGGDWLAEDGTVRMDEQVVIDTLKFMDQMMKDGTAVATPGANHHSEEYYGWMNAGNCASVVMPFWYTDRFLNYMPDLQGKMKVAPMPVWADGGYKTAQMGGTGTAVVKTSKNVELAKEYLAFATLSYDAGLQSWKLLGFDPIRTDLYGTEDLKADNKFFQYYEDDIFSAIEGTLDSVAPTCLIDTFPLASDIVKQQMAYNLFVLRQDPETVAQDCAEELRMMIE